MIYFSYCVLLCNYVEMAQLSAIVFKPFNSLLLLVEYSNVDLLDKFWEYDIFKMAGKTNLFIITVIFN